MKRFGQHLRGNIATNPTKHKCPAAMSREVVHAQVRRWCWRFQLSTCEVAIDAHEFRTQELRTAAEVNDVRARCSEVPDGYDAVVLGLERLRIPECLLGLDDLSMVDREPLALYVTRPAAIVVEHPWPMSHRDMPSIDTPSNH